jgi:tetratricopeptide (TPR) repeat protein
MKQSNFLRVGIVVTMFMMTLISSKLHAQTLTDAIKLMQSDRLEDADEMFNTLVKQNATAETYYYYGKNVLDMYIADPFSNSASAAAQQALSIFKEGLDKDSTNALNNIGIGMSILFQKNDTTLADTYFKKAEAQFPKKKKAYTEYHVKLLMELGDAQMYAKAPRFNKAINYLKTAIEVAPKNTDAYIVLGDIYNRKMEPSNAILNYNKAAYINPNLAMAIVRKGYLYLRSRNLQDSRTEFEKALKIDSTYAPAYKGLGELYNLGGAYNLSKTNFKKYLDLLGNNIPARISYLNVLFKAKDYNEVYNNVDEILAVNKTRAYIYRLGAYASYDKRPADYNKALEYMETFFVKTTSDKIIPKDYTYYGRILLKVKKDSAMIDKGFENLVKASELDTTDQTIITDIIINAYYLKRYDLAISTLNKKISKGEASIDDYMMLGKTYYQKDMLNEADSTFTKITEMEPDNIQAYVWLANTASKQDPDSKKGLAKSKYEKVIEKCLPNADKNTKDLLSAYNYMASYYLIIAKEYEKADEYAQKILSLDSKNTTAYFYLAIASISRKNYGAAKNYYSKILEFDPNNAAAKKGVEEMKKQLARK